MPLSNLPQEVANPAKTASTARAWPWTLLAIGLSLGLAVLFASNPRPLLWSGLSKPWPRIISIAVAAIVGGSLADRIRALTAWFAGRRKDRV